MPPGTEPLRACVCGHAREAHEHYRRGSDCGICGAAACPRYRTAPVSSGRKP